MDTFLIPLHSICRWLVLASALYAIGRAYMGFRSHRDFSLGDDRIRHYTATIAHIQLIIGMVLYIRSPVTSYFWENVRIGFQHIDTVFYGLLHPLLMLLAVIAMTIGSSVAKRQRESRNKHMTILIWFSVALLIIFLAIPWPFSFVSQRPYFRGF